MEIKCWKKHMKDQIKGIILFLLFIISINCICLLGVNAQGNRGVVINNKKFDDSSGVGHMTTHQFFTSLSLKAPSDKTTNSRLESFSNETPLSTLAPIFSSDRRSKVPEEYKIYDFLGIEKILHQNQSDVEKLDELVNKLNKTGALSKVNIESNTMQIRHSTTPLPRSTTLRFKDNINVQSYVQNDHQKDSKELKVQFVLDCDLKDYLNSNSNLNQPVIPQTLPYTILSNPGVKKNEIRYPNYESQFNQRIPTKKKVMSYYQTTRRSYYPTKTQTKWVVKTVTTPKAKIKYVDPPAVAAISNAFENVYNYFEDALTTNVVEKIPRDKKRILAREKVPVHGQGRNPLRKRSTVNVLATTSRPEYRYTKAHSNGPNQKLTTQIHVTSEYVGTEPPGGVKQNENISDESESGEYDDDLDDAESDEEYSDEDESDYDYDFSFGSFGGGDEEDDESSELNEQYDSDTPNKLYKSNRKSPKKKKRVSKPDSHDESEEDDGFTMTNMGKYFQQTYDSISEYIPVFPSIFGSDDDEKNDDDETTSRIPKKKISPYSRSPNRIEVKETNKKWYDKFFFGSDADSDEVEYSSINIAAPSTTTEAGLFQWFASSEDNMENVITKPETDKPLSSELNPNWFSSLFYGSETTTIKFDDISTKASIISNDKKNEWFAMLAAHMGTMTTPTTHTMNRTNVLRRIKYDDYQIWRVTLSTQAQLAVLREYNDSYEEEKILWLKGPAMRGPNDILISPDMNKEIQEMLEYESIPYEVIVWDLEKAIKYENPIMSRRQKIELEKEQGHPMTWFRYHNFEDIAIYLDHLQITYPDIVELIHIGRSFEGRPLICVKISFDSIDGGPTRNNVKFKASQKNRRKKKTLKPGVFIEAGVHGREWISPAVATWILRELVKFNNTENGNTEKELVRSVDWYILPVSNPDGYEFSLNYDRLWRKTRSKLPESGSSMLKYALKWLRPEQKNDAPICYGTDPSRNYDINWKTQGSSQCACSELYAGPKPFSEPETKALAAFLNENRKMISIFLSLHSYGQFISYPSTANSTYGATQRSNDLRDMAEVAVNALRDFASTGRYSIDSTNEMLSVSSGTSTDYAMHKAGIKYSYTIELRDTGTQGFLLSPSYIDITGLETFEMVKAMADFL